LIPINFHDKFIPKDFIFDIYLNLFRGLGIFDDTTMLLSLIPPLSIVVPKHSTANPTPVTSDIVMNSHNLETTTEQPANTTVNIQHGCLTSWASVGGPCSSSPSPIDFYPPLNMDYAEQISAQNNMNIKVNSLGPTLTYGNHKLLFNFSLPAFQPTYVNSMEMPNPSQAYEHDSSIESFPSTVIPYSANVPANLSLWDSNFRATSLFSTNKMTFTT